MQSVRSVIATQATTSAVYEEKILGVQVLPPRQPSPQVLRRLRPKEPHAVFGAFPTADHHRAGGEVHIFYAKAQSLGNP
jgi:hypothetical protein